MATSLPSSGSLSIGTRAGTDRSVNLFKNDVISTTTNTAKFSLKESSDVFAAAKSDSLVLPQMVVGPPYKFSELYGAERTKFKQIISWSVVVDGSDYYTWKPNIKGVLVDTITNFTLLSVNHSGGQQLAGTVTNVFNFFKNKPNKINVRVTSGQSVTSINGVMLINTGNNSSRTVDTTIDINPTSNGSFSYTTGNTGGRGGNWGGGTTTITINEQTQESSSLIMTHRKWQYPGNSSITSTLYKNNIAIATHSATGANRGTTVLPFGIIQTTTVDLKWSGRSSSSITEYPSISNGYSTTVLIDDDGPGAAGWYSCTLTLEA